MTWVRVVSTAVLAAGLVGCSTGTSVPTAPTTAALSADARAALERSIQDEYRAEAIYQGVVDDFGSVLPFVNILTAEKRHSAALVQLFTKRGLTPPASEWRVDNVPRYASVSTACSAAVEAELDNIAMYDQLLAANLPDDVRQVFTSNRSASLRNHLPAFERCS